MGMGMFMGISVSGQPAAGDGGGGELMEPAPRCANHPEVETYLRCNKCDKPICINCAVLTEVGYRCKECIREQQKVFYNAVDGDNLKAFAVAAGVTLVAAPLLAFLLKLVPLFFGFIIAFLTGSGAGATLGQFIRQAVQRRRGPNLRWFALAGILLGIVLSLVLVSLLPGFGIFSLVSLQGLLFAVLAVTTAYQMLK
jgi:hypothetical protein